MKLVKLFLVLAVFAVPVYFFASFHDGGVSNKTSELSIPGGAVPDYTTAIGVARVVLMPIHGKEMIRGEDYFSAELKGEKWVVTCFLPEETGGGKAFVDISKADGRITRIAQEKPTETK